MPSRAELIVKFNDMQDKYREVIEEVYEARRYIATGISKLDDIVKKLREGWGYKNGH